MLYLWMLLWNFTFHSLTHFSTESKNLHQIHQITLLLQCYYLKSDTIRILHFIHFKNQNLQTLFSHLNFIIIIKRIFQSFNGHDILFHIIKTEKVLCVQLKNILLKIRSIIFYWIVKTKTVCPVFLVIQLYHLEWCFLVVFRWFKLKMSFCA